MDMQTIGVISQERLKVKVELLSSDDRKSCIPRRLAQQRMTPSDIEWPFSHRALSLQQLSLFHKHSPGAWCRPGTPNIFLRAITEIKEPPTGFLQQQQSIILHGFMQM